VGIDTPNKKEKEFMTAKRTQFRSTRENTFTTGQNLTAFKPKSKIGPIFSTIIVVGLVAILAVVYLFQITKSTSYGYALDEVETRKAELSAEREDLRNENARLQAARVVNTSGTVNYMTTPASTEYAN